MRFFRPRRQHALFRTLAGMAKVGCVLAWLLVTEERAAAHGEYHEALAVLQGKIAETPRDAALIRQRAALHLTHAEWKKALADAAAADRRDGRVPDSGWIRGCALREMGKLHEARAAFDQYLAAYPERAQGWLGRARVWERLGKAWEAAADYREAMRLSAEMELEQVLEWTVLEKRAGGIQAALDAVDQGIKRLGTVDALQRLGVELELEAGEWRAAEKRAKRALRQGGDPLYWLVKKTEIAEAAGDVEGTKRAWAEVKGHVQAMPSLQRGRPEARELLEKASRGSGEAGEAPIVRAPPKGG